MWLSTSASPRLRASLAPIWLQSLQLTTSRSNLATRTVIAGSSQFNSTTPSINPFLVSVDVHNDLTCHRPSLLSVILFTISSSSGLRHGLNGLQFRSFHYLEKKYVMCRMPGVIFLGALTVPSLMSLRQPWPRGLPCRTPELCSMCDAGSFYGLS